MIYRWFCCSVKHEYEGQWSGNKTRLSTCDPHARRSVVNSDAPQEVEANKDIIFTYDVDFQVRLDHCLNLDYRSMSHLMALSRV